MNHLRSSSIAATAVAVAFVAAACADNGNQLSTYPDPVGGGVDVVEPPEPFPVPAAKGPQPDFGATVTQLDSPPPLSGGTLLVTRDGTRAIAADPDRDRIYVVTLADQKVLTLALSPHDEPGRVVEDADGRAHVVLRRGGGIATLEIATATLLSRRATCAAPRGIAFDDKAARLLVACEGGEVLALGPTPDGVLTPLAHLDRDLRDVVVSGSRIFVSRFRSAEILEVDATGSVLSRSTPQGSPVRAGTAAHAWRMIAAPPSAPSGEPIVIHQSAATQVIAPAPGGYGGGGCGGGGDLKSFCGPAAEACTGGGIVPSMISAPGASLMILPDHAVLPVDLAFDGSVYAVVAAGNGHTKDLPQVFLVDAKATNGNCVGGTHLSPSGQVTSIALRTSTTGPTRYLVQSREPAQLQLLPEGDIISLSTESREDTGHAIFHSNSGAGIACASCHGEGGDDGHVWDFVGTGRRRTPSLRGTLQGTAPYHWGGEMTDLSMLVEDVLTGRMSGPSLGPTRKAALQSWLFALPAPASPAGEKEAVDRGRALFHRESVGCNRCHAGARYTSSGMFDVGTGGAFQVPSLLGVGARAPYLHDGCAATLRDRFGSCGGGDQHGSTAQLSGAQVDDLVTYLNTL